MPSTALTARLVAKLNDLKKYIKETKTYDAFKDMTFKWSEGAREDFPRLSVKVRDEIVTFGVADQALKLMKKALLVAVNT